MGATDQRAAGGAEATLAAFREAMSLLVSGVAAVTVAGEGRRPRGMLATSISSYTDSPPSLLLSIAHASRSHDPLLAAASCGVHLLGHDQTELATVLAGKGEDKFATLDWEWDGAVPRLLGAVAYLRCGVGATFGHHDHTIVIADVDAIAIADAHPLVYFQRTLGWRLTGAV